MVPPQVPAAFLLTKPLMGLYLCWEVSIDMKRKVFIRLVAILCICCLLCITALAATQPQEAVETAQKMIDQSGSYLSKTAPGSWSLLMARKLAATPSEAAIEDITGRVRTAAGNYQDLDDLSYDILSLTALGYPANDYEGIDLIDALCRYELDDTVGTRSIAMALLALDSAHYPVPEGAKLGREQLVDALLARQAAGGGFCGEDGTFDVDATAWALTALAGSETDVAVMDAAFSALAAAQQDDASYTAPDGTKCELTSHVIIALAANGRSVLDPAFVQQSGSLLDALAACQGSDGGFAPVPGGTSDMASSEQAILALCSITQKDEHPSAYVFADDPTALSPLKTHRQITWSFFGLLILACAAIYGCLVLTVLIGKRFKK